MITRAPMGGMPGMNSQARYLDIPFIEEFKLDAYGHLSFVVGFSDEDDPTPEPEMVLLARAAAGELSEEELELALKPRDVGDWIACADFERQGDWVGYHVVVNSDSGGFIETMEQGVLTLEDARAQLPGLLEAWYDRASENVAEHGAWYTKIEEQENQRAIERWKRSIQKVLA